jgi:hypothetical protein
MVSRLTGPLERGAVSETDVPFHFWYEHVVLKKRQMKLTILLLALISPIIGRAQTPTQPVTDKFCEQEGTNYVTDKNKDEFVPEPGQSFYWSFLAAHFDSRTNTCYVMYDRFPRGLGKVLEQIKIDDIEGHRVAGYSGTWNLKGNGHPAYSKPSECVVSGTSCESMAEFEDLLGKLIPAFRKNTRHGEALCE